MAFQTLFYEIESGRVVNIQKNFLIRKQAQKKPYSGGLDIERVGVFYLDGDEPLEVGDVEVKKVNGWGVRLVVDKNGRYRSLERRIEKQRAKLANSDAVLFICEGGLGDHLLQAAALLDFKAVYPEKWCGLRVHPECADVLGKVEGLDWVGVAAGVGGFPKGLVTIGGACEMMADPRGRDYGKKSIYGTMLGLEKITGVAKIRPSEADYAASLVLLEEYQREWDRPLVGIQFNSASGRGKSWPLNHVRALVRKIYEFSNAEAIVFGRGWEYPKAEPLGMNFSGEKTWLETYLALIVCDVVVCIDSGVLHLCRSLGKPYLGIWGGSTPEWILGEPDRPEDLREPMECADWLCMECVKKTAPCMSGVSPDRVYGELAGILEGIETDEPRADA